MLPNLAVVDGVAQQPKWVLFGQLTVGGNDGLHCLAYSNDRLCPLARDMFASVGGRRHHGNEGPACRDHESSVAASDM
jgi:hypothetical protein